MEKSTFLGRPQWQIVLAVAFFVQLVTSMGFSLVYPFMPLYISQLGSMTGMSVELLAGLAFSVQGLTMMIASPFWGALADRYGRRLMVLRATLGGAGIMALMGMVQNGEQLVLLRALQGFVTGTVGALNALVASQVPRERVGFALGTLQVGLWAGIALGPIVGGVLADNFGYAMPFFITGGALLLAGLLVLVLLPADQGHKHAKVQTNTIPLWIQWKTVLRSEGVALLFVLRFFDGVGRSLLAPIAALFVVSLLNGETANQSLLVGAVAGISSASSTFSAVYFGRMGDRIGHRTILVFSALATTLLYVPQAFVQSVWQLLLLQALAGISLGGILSSASALLARYTQRGQEGAVYGIDNSVSSGARALAPLLGSTVALVFGLRGTFALTAVLFAIVAVCSYQYLPQDHTHKFKTVSYS